MDGYSLALVIFLVVVILALGGFCFLLYMALEVRDSTIETYREERLRLENKLLSLTSGLRDQGLEFKRFYSDSLIIGKIEEWK